MNRYPGTFAFIALTGAISSAFLSIAASQILLFAAILCVLFIPKRGAMQRIELRPSFLWPLFAFSAWSLFIALISPNLLEGLKETRRFFLFSILFLVLPVLRNSNSRIFRMYACIFVAALVAALIGLVQFAFDPRLDLFHRISGPMSHWMTYSGLLMLALVGLSSYAVCRRGRIPWWIAPLGLLLIAGMYVSQTRSSWLGSIAGLAFVLLLRRPRAVFAMAALLVALYFVSPRSIHLRLQSGWDQSDPENRSRIELLQTSLRLIRDHPLRGVGPENVKKEALFFRGTHEFGDWLYQHMHNNILQIAAGYGIPGLLLWLWLIIRLGWDAWCLFRLAATDAPATDPEHSEAAILASTAALGAWVAFFGAGMFEYNFGDSEVLMLYLFMAAAPYAFERNRSCRIEGQGVSQSICASRTNE